MTIYYTSDLHVGHRLVAGIRGFWKGDVEPGPTGPIDICTPDVDSHSRAIADAWSVVKPDDIVWILGDICISERTWKEALQLISRLPGRKRLIPGNHDPVSSIYRDAHRHHAAARGVFETVQDFARTKIGAWKVYMSHYPYRGTGSEGMRDRDRPRSVERYPAVRLTDYGTPLLHGHTHGTERLHFSDAGTPEVHVGLDAWSMQLVPQEQVEVLLNSLLK